MMKLRNRTFVYSLFLAILVCSMVFAYMLFLMPSLYFQDMMKKNLSDLKETHKSFLQTNNLNLAKGNIKDNLIGLTIDDDSYDIEIKSVGMKGTLSVKDKEIKDLIDEIRSRFSSEKQAEVKKLDDDVNNYLDLLIKKLEDKSKPLVDVIRKMISIRLDVEKDFFSYDIDKSNVYTIGKNTVILESSIISKSTKTNYLSYIALSKLEGRLYVTLANTFMPNPDQIRPTIVNSLYVIPPLIFLLSLLISSLLSKKIVKPIELLSKDADMRKGYNYADDIEVKGDEEIQNLADSLNLLYKSQRESIEKLRLENEKKEVFMRAFSHQLKTPLASSSLLVDSMIANVGKFSDRDKYLPELKKELNSMKKILSRILDVNNMVKKINIDKVNLKNLVYASVSNNKIEIEEKSLNISINGEATWDTDTEILYQIINNLINNAIRYTPESGFIEIDFSCQMLIIKNFPARLESSMKNAIFEAFVTGDNQKGSGLGLYVSKHFADSLNLEINVDNVEDKVIFAIKRKDTL